MLPLFFASGFASPLVALAVSVALIVVLIGVLRLHAFFALILAAATVSLLTAGDGLAGAIESMLAQFGASVGQIGFSIAAAAVIGAALLERGAADRIVRTFLGIFGEKYAPLALLCAGFVLGIPVFFDTVFFLLVPLARALSARTGKNYVLHLLAICAGSVVTHATVPPTPGPLAMAEILKLDLGAVLVVGCLAGIVPALAGLWYARWCGRRMAIPLRTVEGASGAAAEAAMARDISELPGFALSIAPVVLPIILIAAASVAASLGGRISPGWAGGLVFFGNKNVALFLGAVIAVAVYLRQKRLGWRNTDNVIGEPLAIAGVIILITAAGGAYGATIKNAGVGDLIRAWAETMGVNILVLGWGLAAFLRAAQGSTTVAVITTSGLMMSMAGAEGFGVSPLYLYLAIGYGGLFCSWMNDSGFWIFSRMSGLTERETLRSWSGLLSVISLVGLGQVLLLSAVFPGHA
jgi:GntP family gluconate:H+ symporter